MIVEDGTGLPDANSYVPLEFAESYFSARSITTWAELDDEGKESVLIRASDFVNSSFKWNGRKKTREQSLAFPRSDLFDVDGYEVDDIPTSLKQAVCDAALEVSAGNNLYQVSDANGAVVSERVDVISTTYDVSSRKQDITLYDSINTKLRGLYSTVSSKSRIVSSSVSRA